MTLTVHTEKKKMADVVNERLNTGMAPTCNWMIKIVKVNKLTRHAVQLETLTNT